MNFCDLYPLSSQDWWKVEFNGKQGFIPAAYVRKVTTPPSSSESTPASSTFSLNLTGQDTVQTRQASIKSKYSRLQILAKERRQKLEESKKKFFLMREINELEHWISDKEALAGGEEMGKDLEHVQALLKKEDDFKKDMEGNEPRLDSINKMGEDLIEEGHSEGDEIQRICEVGKMHGTRFLVYIKCSQNLDSSLTASRVVIKKGATLVLQ